MKALKLNTHPTLFEMAHLTLVGLRGRLVMRDRSAPHPSIAWKDNEGELMYYFIPAWYGQTDEFLEDGYWSWYRIRQKIEFDDSLHQVRFSVMRI